MLTQFVGKTGSYRLPYGTETRATVTDVIHQQNALGAGSALFVMDNGDRVNPGGVYFDGDGIERMASATS